MVIIVVILVTPKVEAKHELLFNKLTSAKPSQTLERRFFFFEIEQL
jgi:hypothetical protein